MDQAWLLSLTTPAFVFLAALSVLLLTREAVLRALARRHAASQSPLPGALRDALRLPSFLWALAAALNTTLDYTRLPPGLVNQVNLWVGAFLILSLTLVVAGIASRLISHLGERRNISFAVAGISRTLIYFFVFGIGLAVFLRHLGKSVTPLLTALGVSGVAIALALQDTLANLFAGIHILMEEPVRLGDIIRLSSGEEGVVSDIGWRTTRLRTLNNNTIVIPNKSLTSTILTNYSMPQKRLSVEVAVLVAHEADIDQVRRLALAVVPGVEGVLDDPAPLVVIEPGVTPTHVAVKLVVSVGDKMAEGPVRSELRLRLLRRFQQEGVPPPNASRAGDYADRH